MSFVSHDLKCANDHEERSVLYRRSEGPPPCPACAAPRHIWYAMAERPTDHTVGGEFQSFIHDGVRIESADQWRRVKAEYARQAGIPVDQVAEVSVGSKRERKARADEFRHQAHQVRVANGFDDRTFNSYLREQKERGAPRVRTGWTR